MSIVKKFDSIKGAKLISLRGYESSKTKEIANHVINVNVSIENAKKADLETLKNFKATDLMQIASKVGATCEEANKALNEMIISAEKNLNPETATNASKAQSETYINIGKGLRLKETANGEFVLYISGFAHSKKVTKEGEYKTVNSRPKTLVKNEITRNFLKMYKFRNFQFKNAESLKVRGNEIIIKGE